MVKKLGTLVSEENELIHSPFHGERLFGREALTAKIKINDTWRDITLWSYSPFGIEFLKEDINVTQGQPLNLRVKLAGDETEFDSLVVNSIYDHEGTKLVGIRTFIPDKIIPQHDGEERRVHRRWSCSEDFLPTGTAPNPVRYNDYILFRVEDISSGGLKLITSMRNKLLSIGQRLECTLSFPYVGTVRADIKVKYVNTTFYKDKEFMVMGVEFVKTDPILLKSLGEYLLNFAKKVTVRSLNDEGFRIKKVSKWLDFSYVKTEEEYKEVLELRYSAYKAAKKVSNDANPKDLADEFDAKSKIIIAKYDGKIVGTIRCIFPTNELETELHTESIPRDKMFYHNINEITEASRLAIDESFRKIDIKFEILSYMILTTIQGNRRYIYTAAASDVLEFYKDMGFEDKKTSFPDPHLNNIIHHLIILDTYSACIGDNVKYKTWIKIYNRLYDFLIANKLIEPNPANFIKLKFYKAIGRFFYRA